VRRGEARTSILGAARVEFGSHGFSGARVDQIARRAGVNKQLIYYYFGSKRGLFRAATAPLSADIEQPTAGGGTAPDRFRTAIGLLFAELAERPEFVSLLVDRSQAGGTLAGQWAREKSQTLARLVSHGQGMGYFRDDVDPDLLARQAVVLCAGYHALGHHVTGDAEVWLRATGDMLLRVMAW
jgi:TetR/AcrR family transcriptional regulator